MWLITPDIGLLFWMLVTFGILMVILKKFAWKPILQGIKSREEKISKSLREAEYARNEIAKLEVRNVELVRKAQADRDAIMLEAKRMKDKIIEEASAKAKEEAKKYLEQARETISRERETAQLELKAYASQIVFKIAEQILRRELEDKDKYQEQVVAIIKQMESKN